MEKKVNQEYVHKNKVEADKKRLIEDINKKHKNEIICINTTNKIEKDDLKNKIKYLTFLKDQLEEKNGDLSKYIADYLYDNVQVLIDNLTQREKRLKDHEERKLFNLAQIRKMIYKKDKEVEEREKKVTKDEEKNKKDMQAINKIYKDSGDNIKLVKKWDRTLDDRDHEIRKIWDTVLKIAKKLEEQQLNQQ